METDSSRFDASLEPWPIATYNKIRSYSELREFVRISLRIQHPEWIEPNGDSPVCDSYEARFAEILGLSNPRKTNPANPLVPASLYA
jgi:hypothetical protein